MKTNSLEYFLYEKFQNYGNGVASLVRDYYYTICMGDIASPSIGPAATRKHSQGSIHYSVGQVSDLQEIT